MTKGYVLFAVLAANILGNVNSSENNAYYIELLSPRGFRVFILNPITQSDSDTFVPFDSFVYEYMGQPKRYRGFAKPDPNGLWVYENTDADFTSGHTIVFHLKSMSELDDVRNGYTIQIIVPSDTPRVPV